MRKQLKFVVGLAVLSVTIGVARGEDKSFAQTAEKVNEKMVKLFGAGGIKGLPHYGTGIVISPDGYILTASNHLLDGSQMRVHLADGRRFDQVRRVAVHHELDLAIVKIGGRDKDDDKVTGLPCFDVIEASKRKHAEPGDWVLAFGNCFEIATRDEPMSVQRGAIASFGKLPMRKGAFEFDLNIPIYVIDAITNNPGAAGGAITTRKGELIGVIGKELRNKQTDTWVNYAIPIDEKVGTFVKDVFDGKFVEKIIDKKEPGVGCFHGMVFIANVVERTPPFVEDVVPGSPADKAGVKIGDLIWFVDGQRVGSINQFRDIVDAHTNPNTEIKVELKRGSESKLLTTKMTVEEPKRKPKKPKDPDQDPKK